MARSLGFSLAQSAVNGAWRLAQGVRAAADWGGTWTPVNPPDYLRAGLGSGRSAAGVLVNTRTALTNPAVLAAIRILTEDIAKLPIELVRRSAQGGRRLLIEHPVTKLLTLRPNRWMTPFEFKEFMVAQLMLNGNAIAVIKRDVGGRPLELIPVETPRVTLQSFESELFYNVSANDYQASLMPDGVVSTLFHSNDILHVRGLSLDGLWGLSFVAQCKEAIGGAIAVEQYANALFANSCDPSGILENAGVMSEESYQKLKAQWENRYSGPSNRGRTVILEEGMSFKPLSMTSEDSQYIEVRKHINEDIGRIWRIPQHKLGIMDRQTHSNVEESERSYFDTTISPIIQRFEESYKRSLLRPDTEQRIEISHNIEYFTRARAAERVEIYSKYLNWGVMTINEVREKEGLEPRPDGDVYLLPVNMMIGGPDAEKLKLVGPPKEEKKETPVDEPDKQSMMKEEEENGEKNGKTGITKEEEKKVPAGTKTNGAINGTGLLSGELH